MAIELPAEVVSFLRTIGINWPRVNEDDVREFASRVRELGDKIDATHRHFTITVQQLSKNYQGASYVVLTYEAAESALGVSGGGGSGGGFQIDPDALEEHAEIMHRHAEAVAYHTETFRTKMTGLSFE